MKPPIARKKIEDFESNDLSIDAFSAFECGPDTIRVAVQVSDESLSVGRYFIADISMIRESAINVILSDEEFVMAYQHTADQDIAVEIGNVVRRSSDVWKKIRQGSNFLQGAFIFDKETDYVFGKGGELYSRYNEKFTQLEVPTSNMLLSMHGESLSNLYAAGANGTLLHVDNNQCRLIDVGHGVDFKSVRVVNDDVYIGGDQATVGKLANDEFQVFESELEGDILSICEHDGMVFLSDSEFGVSIVKNGRIEGFAETGYVYRLSSGSKFLTCASGEHVFQFDGANWRGIEIYFENGLRTRFLDMSILT